MFFPVDSNIFWHCFSGCGGELCSSEWEPRVPCLWYRQQPRLHMEKYDKIVKNLWELCSLQSCDYLSCETPCSDNNLVSMWKNTTQLWPPVLFDTGWLSVTLRMLSKIYLCFFAFSNLKKNIYSCPTFYRYRNLSIRQFGFQMKPH